MSQSYVQKKKSHITTSPIVFYAKNKTVNPYRGYSFVSKVYPREVHHDYLAVNEDIFGHGYIDHKLPHQSREIKNLRRVIGFLYSRLQRIESQFPECLETEKVAIKETPLEQEVSVEEAKPEVQSFLKEFLKKEKKVYPSDVADALGLRYETVREVFAVLEREGKLKASK